MTQLYLDIETRSQTDLLLHGLRRYAECPTTGLICVGWAFDDEEVQDWFADEGEPFPQQVIDHIKSGGIIWAHNAAFERHLFEYVICNDYDFDPPAPTQWRCSMVAATTSGFPGGLDAAAEALGADKRKHKDGTRLIRTYCAPGFTTEWMFDDRQLMSQYVKDDVDTMRGIIPCFRPLTDYEWSEYHLNERIADRGISVDLDLCFKAQVYAGDLAREANNKIAEVTGGAMTKHTQRKARDAWLFPLLTESQKKLLVVYKKGEKKISLDADHRDYLLACDDLDDRARQLLEAMNDAGSSALKKYATAYYTHVNERVHNVIQFNGAQTGRYAGRGIQPHNFKKDRADTPRAKLESIIARIKAQEPLDSPNYQMGQVMRGMVYDPDGLAWVDWSQIEARVAPWLSTKQSGDRKLDIFRSGLDVYTVAAAEMFGLNVSEVDKNFRQTGKVAELSLQYAGGSGALQGMARNYGQSFEDDEAADIVRLWRAANPWAEEIWSDYDHAIECAVKYPGDTFHAGRVSFAADENYLWCRLPSERLLSYPRPRIEEYETPWGEVRVGPTFQSHFKPAAGEDPIRLYARGGLLFQNCVAEGEEVLTSEGWKAIEKITKKDLVFDGVSFVQSGGAVFRGVQTCGTLDGVRITEDHLILTPEGWKSAKTVRKIFGKEIGASGCVAHGAREHASTSPLGVFMRLWQGRKKAHERCDQARKERRRALRVPNFSAAFGRETHSRHEFSPSVRGVGQPEGALFAPHQPSVAELRRARNWCVRALDDQFRKLLGGHGAGLRTGVVDRTAGQRAGVLSAELRLEDCEGASREYSRNPHHTDTERGAPDGGGGGYVGDKTKHPALPPQSWVARSASFDDTRQSQEPCYDIINCGPLNRFVVRGRTRAFITHNCTQATAADILREALVEADEAGLEIALHVHDEIVVYGGEAEGQQLNETMLTEPWWAAGLPIATGGVETGERWLAEN